MVEDGIVAVAAGRRRPSCSDRKSFWATWRRAIGFTLAGIALVVLPFGLVVSQRLRHARSVHYSGDVIVTRHPDSFLCGTDRATTTRFDRSIAGGVCIIERRVAGMEGAFEELHYSRDGRVSAYQRYTAGGEQYEVELDRGKATSISRFYVNDEPPRPLTLLESSIAEECARTMELEQPRPSLWRARRLCGIAEPDWWSLQHRDSRIEARNH